EVLLVNLGDDRRPGEGQQLVVALDVVRMIGEALAAELLLGEAVALDHGAHRAIEDEDPAGEELAQPGFDGAHGSDGGDGLHDCRRHWEPVPPKPRILATDPWSPA